MSLPEYPVFTKRGDVLTEVEQLAATLNPGAGDPASIGLHKVFYVTRVDTTVVMVTARETPLAEALRKQAGWKEPKEEEGS